MLTLDPAATSAASATATKAMGLFARRDVSAARWWRDLVPLLSPAAAQAYRYTDPRNVPPTTVTGPGVVTRDSTGQLARVAVATDVGSYLVILSRSTDTPPAWRVERFVPPESLGGS